MTDRDPRVYFAAERTLLAWIRTAVAIIALGFVIARFGLFLELLHPAHPNPEYGGFPGMLGVVLSLAGAALSALSGLQFKAYLHELGPEQLPSSRLTTRLSLILAFSISGVGVTIGAYLLT